MPAEMVLAALKLAYSDLAGGDAVVTRTACAAVLLVARRVAACCRGMARA